MACYPENTPELSESEKQLKTMCEAGLRQAKRHAMENPDPLMPKDLHKRAVLVDKSVLDKGLMPWQIAKRMIASFVGASVEESSVSHTLWFNPLQQSFVSNLPTFSGRPG